MLSRTLEDPGARGARSIWTSLAVFAGLLALFWFGRQSSFWGDGRFLVLWLENGRWGFYHLAYLPVAQLAHLTVGQLMGWTAAETLYFVSAMAGAASGALLFAACRVVGLGTALSLASVALLVSSSVVWFYSTSIEIHSLQLVAAAGALLFGVCAWKKGRLGGNVIAPAVVLAALTTSHVTGVTWAPAMILLALFGSRKGQRGRALIGIAACVAVLGLVFLGVTRFQQGSFNLRLGADSVQSPFALGHGLRELLMPAFGIILLALLAAISTAVSDASRLRSRPGIVTLTIFFSLAPFAFVIEIAERGAYFISLMPLLSFWIVVWVQRSAKPFTWILLVGAVGVQGLLAWRATSEWEESAVPEWVAELQAEAGDRTVLFTMDRPAAMATFRHTPLITFSVVPGMDAFDLSQPRIRGRALAIVEKRARAGYRIAITRDMLQTEDAGTLLFVEEVTALFGPPATGANPIYLLFPCMAAGAQEAGS